MDDNIHSAIRELFDEKERFVIQSHIRPDGDAIGSMLGLGLALRKKGKHVQMVLQDHIPETFRFLQGSDTIQHKVKGSFDSLIVVDCSDPQRLGKVYDVKRIPDLNIDHHVTNLNFAKLNWVEPLTGATAAIIARQIPEWGLTIDEPIAQALLTAIISDTIGFRTSNVTPEILTLASGLMEKGANITDLYNRVLVTRSLESARYWGLGLNKLKKEGRLVWTDLTLEDRKSVDYPGSDDADLVNILSAIDGTDIAIIFIEQKNNHVKVSWRANSGYDISKIAFSFGGGGHPAAAGAEIEGRLAEVEEIVLNATLPLFDNNHTLV